MLDEIVLADIPNLDITSPIDPDTGLPPESQIVHRQNVDQRGRVNNNAVAYTIVMDTTIGDFSFNAMYLRNKQNGVIGMIVYKGRETKLKTDQTTGQTGNSLVKSMLMGYDQAAEATLTHVDAGTWQIDYAARLRGMDEDIRQLQADLYGHHTFVGDGFKVVEKDGAYQVSQGVAIIGGLRVELKAPEVINPGTKTIGVWVDVHRAGSLLSEHQNHFTIITSVADLTDHVDSNGYQHYVAKLGTILADSNIEDIRGVSGGIVEELRDKTDRLLDVSEKLDAASWEALVRSYGKLGYRVVGAFEDGFLFVNNNDVGIHKSSGKGYTGPAGHIEAGTDPTSGGFVDRSSELGVCIGSVCDLSSGVFHVGSRVHVTDRAGCLFIVQQGGIPDGFGRLDAGNGNTAVYAPSGQANPRAYGIGKGGDDSQAFQAFVTDHSNWTGDPELKISIERHVTIPVKESLIADMRGTEITHPGGFIPLRNANGVVYTGSVIGPVVRHTKSITMDSAATASKFSEGDLVQLRSKTLWYFDNRGTAMKGETHIVKSVSGAVVSVESDIFDTYEASETLTLVKIAKSNYQIDGLSIKGPDGAAGGFQFSGLVKSKLDIKVDGSDIVGGLLKDSYAVNTYGNYESCTSSGTGYGLQISQSTFCYAVSAEFFNCRRGVDVSGRDAVSRMCAVLFCTNKGVSDELYSESSGFGSHGSADGTRYFGNKVYSCRQAFVSRGLNEVISENFGYGRMADFVASVDGCGLTVTNNNYRSATSIAAPDTGDSRLLNFVNIYLHDNRGRTTIQGNTADRLVNSWLLITMKSGANGAEAGDVFCTDNQSTFYSNSGGAACVAHKYVPTAEHPSITLKRCKFRHNSHVVRYGGEMVNYDPLLVFDISGAADSANIVEGLRLNLQDVNGNATGMTQRVFADIHEDSIEIYGRIAFTTAAPASIKFSGFPTQRQGQNIGVLQNDYGVGVVSVAYNGTVVNLGIFFISSDPTTPTGNLNAGSHSIMLNFTYENSVSRFF